MDRPIQLKMEVFFSINSVSEYKDCISQEEDSPINDEVLAQSSSKFKLCLYIYP